MKNHEMDSLPHIDCISYKEITAQNGLLYITASGNTRNKTSILKEAGFQWDSKQKLWWKHIQKMSA